MSRAEKRERARPSLPGKRAGHVFIRPPRGRTPGGGRLREYELVVILSPELVEEDVPAAIDRLSQLIADRGGEVKDVDRWGRRKLAYPIKKHLEGNYLVTQVMLDPNRTSDVEAALRISEEVLRHLLVRVGD
jgi:small subunit ribosomal protein S6